MSAKQFSSAGYEVSDLNDHINVASHNISIAPTFPFRSAGEAETDISGSFSTEA